MRTILIVNALPAMRAGLRAILQDAGISTITAEAGTTKEAQDRSAMELSLVIMDPNMPDLNPPLFIRRLRKRDTTVPILFFGGECNALTVSVAMKSGADGYLDASSGEKVIAATIHMILSGMQCFPKNSLPSELSGRIKALTHRELSILLLLRQGVRNKDIATELYLSEKTISAHKHNILVKLGISTIAQFIEHEARAPALHAVVADQDAAELSETPIVS